VRSPSGAFTGTVVRLVEEQCVGLLRFPLGLGCAKTKTDFALMPSGRRIFAIFCSERNHKPQYCGCGHTAWSFHTARVIFDRSAGQRACPHDHRSRQSPQLDAEQAFKQSEITSAKAFRTFLDHCASAPTADPSRIDDRHSSAFLPATAFSLRIARPHHCAGPCPNVWRGKRLNSAPDGVVMPRPMSRGYRARQERATAS
jgi:hypothetical protein